MSDNPTPATKPDPEVAPGEFDFTKPVAENPRIKRRSLKAKKTPALPVEATTPEAVRELEREAPPLAAAEAKPEFQSDPRHDDDAENNAAVKMTEPAPARPAYASTVKPSQPQAGHVAARLSVSSTPSASPHGTRPATLYYSSAPRKNKESAPASPAPSSSPAPSPTSMKSTSTVNPTASSTAAKASPLTTTTAASVRPAGVVDYRANVERQAREQKSVGGVLSILVYTLIGFFVLFAILAGYGAYVVSVQLHQQSVTVSDLDQKYDAAVKDLNVKLVTTNDTLALAQTQIARQQQLLLKEEDTILKQQEAIARLTSAAQENAAAVRQERASRVDAEENIRARLKDLEYQSPITHKY